MAGVNILRCSLRNLSCVSKSLTLRNAMKLPAITTVRNMGHGRTMGITPSRYEYQVFKDHLHFYIALAAIPLGCFVTYLNVFVGQAELADIPDDYEPEYYEYHKHPVKRFLAKHFYDSPERMYERTLHSLGREMELIKLREQESRWKEVMSERGDYKAWYYTEVPSDGVYKAHQYTEDALEGPLSFKEE